MKRSKHYNITFKQSDRIDKHTINMNEKKKKVKDLCDEIYTFGFSQIVIDLVQDEIEELIEDSEYRRDDIMARAYQCSILSEVMNPSMDKDLDWLERMEIALNEWGEDHEAVNRILGLPPEA